MKNILYAKMIMILEKDNLTNRYFCKQLNKQCGIKRNTNKKRKKKTIN
jgi:hypothetical protein